MIKSRSIMLVDDNKIDLFIHGEVIKKTGFGGKVICFTSGGDALNHLSDINGEWPDIILLDIHMPIMNGFDFLTRYEKLPEANRQKCKVVMVSSSLDSEDLKKAKTNSEVADFLGKPLDHEKLSALFASVF